MLFNVQVDFLFSATVELEAPDAATAQLMVEGATADQIAHIHGKSYASVDEAIRTVNSVTEVV